MRRQIFRCTLHCIASLQKIVEADHGLDAIRKRVHFTLRRNILSKLRAYARHTKQKQHIFSRCFWLSPPFIMHYALWKAKEKKKKLKNDSTSHTMCVDARSHNRFVTAPVWVSYVIECCTIFNFNSFVINLMICLVSRRCYITWFRCLAVFFSSLFTLICMFLGWMFGCCFFPPSSPYVFWWLIWILLYQTANNIIQSKFRWIFLNFIFATFVDYKCKCHRFVHLLLINWRCVQQRHCEFTLIKRKECAFNVRNGPIFWSDFHHTTHPDGLFVEYGTTEWGDRH